MEIEDFGFDSIVIDSVMTLIYIPMYVYIGKMLQPSGQEYVYYARANSVGNLSNGIFSKFRHCKKRRASCVTLLK